MMDWILNVVVCLMASCSTLKHCSIVIPQSLIIVVLALWCSTVMMDWILNVVVCLMASCNT